MVEVKYSRTVFLNEVAIFDAGASLTVWLWQSHGSPRPFTLRIGDDEWEMSAGEASGLASATRLIGRSIDRAADLGEPPKSRAAYHRDLPFDDGTALAFEMGVAAEPAHFFFSWGGLRIVPSPTKRDQIFIAFETVSALASQMPHEGGSGLASQLAGYGRG